MPKANPDYRTRILDAAREVMSERGFESDIHEVIERAGVGVSTVYRHFPNKEALFRAVTQEMVDKTRLQFLDIAVNYRDAIDCIALTMKLGFENVEQYGHLAIQMFSGAEPKQYSDLFDREALEAFFAALIERGIHQGHFRKDLDVRHAVGVWFALVAPKVLSRMMAEHAVQDIAHATTDFFLAGLTHPPAPRELP